MSNKLPPLTSLKNPLVKHLIRLRTETGYRNATGCLVLEGLKPIGEIPESIIKVYYTSEYFEFADRLNVERQEVTLEILRKVSGMKNPEGIIAEVHMPPTADRPEGDRVVVFDGVADPGNMGTLMRTALAFGWHSVYFLPGCCDPFNEKVLRSARGAHFKMHLSKGNASRLRDWVQETDAEALAADFQGSPPELLAPSGQRVLVLGNEARGIGKDVTSFCSSVTLPMSGEMESLNVAVAGGILLYTLSRDPTLSSES